MSQVVSLLELAADLAVESPTPEQVEQARAALVTKAYENLKAEDIPITPANLAARLPQDFEFDPDLDMPKAAEPAPTDTETPLQVQLEKVERELWTARQKLAAATAGRQLARAAVSRALGAYENGGRVAVDDATLRRDYIADSQRTREANKHQQFVPPGGNSEFPIDRNRARWSQTQSPAGKYGDHRGPKDEFGNRGLASSKRVPMAFQETKGMAKVAVAKVPVK